MLIELSQLSNRAKRTQTDRHTGDKFSRLINWSKWLVKLPVVTIPTSLNFIRNLRNQIHLSCVFGFRISEAQTLSGYSHIDHTILPNSALWTSLNFEFRLLSASALKALKGAQRRSFLNCRESKVSIWKKTCLKSDGEFKWRRAINVIELTKQTKYH